MKPRIYIESSIISYLTSRPSRDLVNAARQRITHDWWEQERPKYELFISEFVINEIGLGDEEMAIQRLRALHRIPEIKLGEEALRLGEGLIESGPLPRKAELDAFHIAAAVLGGADFLLTWNFKHLANANLRTKIEQACRDLGYDPCTICTPEELKGD